MAGLVHSPEKELRFTRSGQAAIFWVLAAVCSSAAVTLVATALYREVNPHLPHPAWGLLPLALACMAGWIALHLTRHAYLILTPLGIEIFPFFRPARGMQLVTWQEISSAEVAEEGCQLSLHYNPEKTAGIHLSLRPLPAERRRLLAKAVLGRLA